LASSSSPAYKQNRRKRERKIKRKIKRQYLFSEATDAHVGDGFAVFALQRG
jgi:hypothetical protein